MCARPSSTFRRRSALGFFTLCAATLLPASVRAQEPTPAPGRIVGHVRTDHGTPVASAVIEVLDATPPLRTSSGADGRYTIQGVRGATVTLRVRAIGYAPLVVTEVAITPDGVVEQDMVLQPQAIELEEITVVAGAARGSIASSLEEQRYASNIVSAISEEQIARSPDTDAAEAMSRVSGVTVRDDKYVFVRGLGERYTNTSLDGARIPSLDPEKKLVPLDLFPSGMLEGITTSKTYTPDQAADFAGATVNLRTREFPAGRRITVSSTIGVNSEVTGKTLPRAPYAGDEWLGLAGSQRALPPALKEAGSLRGASVSQINSYIASFRDAWSSRQSQGLGNGGVSLSMGGEDPIFGHLIGYLLSGTYKLDQRHRADESRALATAGGPINQYSGSTVTNSVLMGGIANLTSRLGPATTLRWNNAWNRSGDNTATVLNGIYEEFSGEGTLQFTRLSYVSRSVWSSQLSGDHLVWGRHRLAWRGGLSGTRRYEPDRSDLIYRATVNPTTGVVTPHDWADLRQSATRTFSDLHENVADVGSDLTISLGNPVRPLAVKVGGAYRDADRDAPSQAYDIRNLTLDDNERAQPPEVVFGTENAMNGRLTLQANALAGSYAAKEKIAAGYAQVEVPLGENIRVIAGARIENWDLRVTSTDLFGRDTVSNPSATDILPALAVNLRLTPDQHLRLSASQTVSRPEYREVAAVSSVEILGDKILLGNPDLRRGLVQNYDARWEWYPRSGEVVSLALFAKRFSDPIEQVIVGTTGAAALQFLNAERAVNYGVEVELRKNLDFVSQGLANVDVLLNSTVMQSKITLNEAQRAALTNEDRPMVGQAPYVVNAGFGWHAGDQWSAELLYNVVGRRIIEAGQQPLPDTYEEARHLIDFSLRAPLIEGTSVKLDIKNILDAPYRVTQGDVVRVRYRTGRAVSVGFSWDL